MLLINTSFLIFVFFFLLIVLISSQTPFPVVEIKSDTSVAEAVRLLSQHKILSVPIVDVDAPEDASWMDRYIGIVEFAGIVVWILHQVCTNTFITSKYNRVECSLWKKLGSR